MSLIVRIKENLDNCQISIVAGDAADSKEQGTLTVLIQGCPPMTQIVDLVYPPVVISFPNTPRDGKVHNVTATLVSRSSTNSDYAILQLC